jgi:hypothetical protein
MELTGGTKILPLVDEFPFLVEFLGKIDPKFKQIASNKILRKTVGKKATIADVAQIGKIPLSDFLTQIAAEITSQSKQKIEKINSDAEQSIHGWNSERDQRRDFLKSLVLELHEGGELGNLQKRFKTELGNVQSSEIAEMEQELINSGELTAEQITKLCDLHVGIFKESFTHQIKSETIPGHPVHSYMEENRKVEEIIKNLQESFSTEKFSQLFDLDKHYLRLENQLFPLLEKHGFTGPSQVMWAKHDEIRKMWKDADPRKEKKRLDMHGFHPKISGNRFPRWISTILHRN